MQFADGKKIKGEILQDIQLKAGKLKEEKKDAFQPQYNFSAIFIPKSTLYVQKPIKPSLFCLMGQKP
jgi:hypothetical protein